jgi:hypothetical protein
MDWNVAAPVLVAMSLFKPDKGEKERTVSHIIVISAERI